MDESGSGPSAGVTVPSAAMSTAVNIDFERRPLAAASILALSAILRGVRDISVAKASR